MLTILLAIIYLAFISLGLPDSLFGSSWPVVQQSLQVPLSWAGIFSIIVSGGTVISSFFSGKLIRRFGTARVTVVSVLFTVVGIFGISFASNFWVICLLGIPLGLGGGSIDAALNNFVAQHYKSRHMNWLHCFWGLGASLGPIILSFFLVNNAWRQGYRAIGFIQLALFFVVLCSLPLWKKAVPHEYAPLEQRAKPVSTRTVLGTPGVKPTCLAFLAYCALESTAGMWGATYMVSHHGISADIAARLISLYFIGITLGRFLAGFVSDRLGNTRLVLLGCGGIFFGIVALLVPVPLLNQCAFALIGLGCAPIYPALMHDTPAHFGQDLSQSVIGIQMSCAYVGATLLPPVFGLVAQYITSALLPCFLAVYFAVMLLCVLRVRRRFDK